MSNESQTPQVPSEERPLQGWKEIASYLERDQRTARRWEAQEALPVRRHRTDRRSSVYAFPSEIDAWRISRDVAHKSQESESAAPSSRTWIWGAVAAAAIGALLLAGPILNPPNPLADAAAHPGSLVARQVWSSGAGDRIDDSGGLSPDGTRLIYVDWARGALKMRNLDSGETGALIEGDDYTTGNPSGAAYRPDGRAVAYVWEDYAEGQNDEEIRLLELEANHPKNLPRKVLEWDGRITLSGWSPDAKQLLAVLESKDQIQRIALVSVDDGKITTLKTVGWQTPSPFLSPDGRFIAYDLPETPQSTSRNIFVLAADGASESIAVSHPADDVLAGWTPNGNALLFTSDRSGVTSLYTLPVEAGKAAGEPTLVKPGTGPIHAIGAPIGGKLLYSVATRMRHIWLADLTALGDPGGAPKVLEIRAPGNYDGPDFSQDGRFLAFFSSEPRHESATRLVVRDLQTAKDWSFGRETTGITLQGDYGAVRFAPDSRRILVRGWDERNRVVLATVDALTGDTKLVSTPRVNPKGGLFPLDWLDNQTAIIRGGDAWEEDGKERFSNTLIALDVNTRTERLIHRAEGGFMEAAVSPDGHQIVYAYPKQRCIMTVSADTGEAKILASLPAGVTPSFAVAWSVDAQFLYFTVDGGGLWRVPAQGGEAENLGVRLDGLKRLALHPDGRRIALGAGAREIEIWSLENLFGPVSD